MRITELIKNRQNLAAMEGANNEVGRWASVSSSGVKVSAPSVSPATYARIVGKSEKVERLESRREALSRADGDLALAESALASASNILIRAREIAIQFSDSSYYGPEPEQVTLRSAAANELTGLRQELIAIANTRGARGYLFAGSDTDSEAVDSSGVFQGNDDAIHIEVADKQLADANVNGEFAFYGTENAFAVLAGIENGITSGTADDVRPFLDRLDRTQQQVLQTRADAGFKLNRFRTAGDVIASTLNIAKTSLVDLEKGDAAENFSNLSISRQTYERAIAVTRQVLSLASAIERF